MSQWKDQLNEDVLKLNVAEQIQIAQKLASNCGYQLVAEDTERSLEIKELIDRYKAMQFKGCEIVIEGLESLLAKR